MTDLNLIQKTTISVAGIELDVYIKPNGDRYISQKSLTKAIGKVDKSALQMAAGKSPEALLWQEKSALQMSAGKSILGFEQVRYGTYKTLVNLVPLDFTGLYYTYWAGKGNKQAIALVSALAQEALDRRIDSITGQVKTEDQYETQTRINYERVLRIASGYDKDPLIKAETHNLPDEEKRLVYDRVTYQRLSEKVKSFDNYSLYRDAQQRYKNDLKQVQELKKTFG